MTEMLDFIENYDLKVGEPNLFRLGSYRIGQLKERSEGGQTQWQTALGEELAAGS